MFKKNIIFFNKNYYTVISSNSEFSVSLIEDIMNFKIILF